jgi:hypothetical protein
MSKLTIDFNNTSLPIFFKNVPSQHFEWPQSTFTQKRAKCKISKPWEPVWFETGNIVLTCPSGKSIIIRFLTVRDELKAQK